jgi:hypothetical protein
MSGRKLSRRSNKRANVKKNTSNNNTNNEKMVEHVPRFTFRGQNVYGFPDRLETVLRYHMQTALNSTSGSIAKQQFRWNSCFDPDFTGSGHQPLYWDQFTTMYDNYIVTKASAVIKFVNTSTVPFQVGMGTDDDTTASATLDTLCEQNHSKSTLLPPLSGSLSSKTFLPHWDYQTIIGDNPYSSQGAKTGIGADPTQISVLNCYAATVDASSNSCYVDVYLYQTVLFTELKTPTAS